MALLHTWLYMMGLPDVYAKQISIINFDVLPEWSTRRDGLIWNQDFKKVITYVL